MARGDAGAQQPEDEKDFLWLFAYGSNMNSSILEGRRRIAPRSAVVGRVWGYELDIRLRGVPYMEPAFASVSRTTEKDVCVWGAALEVTQSQLDQVRKSESPAYELVSVDVETEDGTVLPAVTLSARETAMTNNGVLWSARYRRLCIEGAKQKGLPDRYVQFLAAHPPYRMAPADMVVFAVLFPLIAPLYTMLMILITGSNYIQPGLTRAIISYFRVLTPALWRAHDFVPAKWRNRADPDLLRQASEQASGERFSSAYRRREGDQDGVKGQARQAAHGV